MEPPGTAARFQSRGSDIAGSTAQTARRLLHDGKNALKTEESRKAENKKTGAVEQRGMFLHVFPGTSIGQTLEKVTIS